MAHEYLSQIAHRQAAEWEVYIATQVSQITNGRQKEMAMAESAAAMQMFNNMLGLMQELIKRQSLRRSLAGE